MERFTREELGRVSRTAERLSRTKGTNPRWVRAYAALADAADRLDGMMKRCEVGHEVMAKPKNQWKKQWAVRIQVTSPTGKPDRPRLVYCATKKDAGAIIGAVQKHLDAVARD